MLTNEYIEKCCDLVGWEYCEMDETSLRRIEIEGRTHAYLPGDLFEKIYYPLLLTLAIEVIEDTKEFTSNIYKETDEGCDKYWNDIYDCDGDQIMSTSHDITRESAKEEFIRFYFSQKNIEGVTDSLDIIKNAAIDMLKGIIADLEGENGNTK